jgi:hypothetical protein
VAWSGAQPVDVSAPWGDRERHRLDVYMVEGEVVDVRLDGESVWPVWFKIEWKGDGEVSAKVRGVRLATRGGDAIAIHQGRPPG